MSLHLERMTTDFKRALSDGIREIHDPRLSKMCSITDLELTKDLMFCKVKMSIYDNDEKRKESLEVLNGAQGMLTKFINSRVKMRRIPRMQFILDDSSEYSVHISKIMDNISKERTAREGDGADE